MTVFGPDRTHYLEIHRHDSQTFILPYVAVSPVARDKSAFSLSSLPSE